MTSNGTLQDGCDERHDVRFRKRWRCLLRINRVTLTVGRPIPVYPDQPTSQTARHIGLVSGIGRGRVESYRTAGPSLWG